MTDVKDASLHPKQSRMARCALQIGVKDVADRAKVSTNTITRLEGGETLRDRTIEDIRRFYESEGVRFIDADEWVGVMVKVKA